MDTPNAMMKALMALADQRAALKKQVKGAGDKFWALTPPPMVPHFLHRHTVDTVVCEKNEMLTHFAWLRADSCIEINAFNMESEEPWKDATCEDCIKKLQDSIVSRCFSARVYVPDRLHKFYPPNAPFTMSQVIQFTRCQTAPIYNYAWIRSDTCIEMAAFNVATMHWMGSMDTDLVERMKLNIRSRGVDKKFVDELPNPWEDDHTYRTRLLRFGNSQKDTFTRQQLEALDTLLSNFMRDVNKRIEKKLDQPVHRDLVWMPSVEQVKQMHMFMKSRHYKTADDQHELAKEAVLSHARQCSEKELRKYDEDLVVLYVDDPCDLNLAAKILVKCAEDYVEQDSEELKYEIMIDNARMIYEEPWEDEEEEAEDSEEPAEEQEKEDEVTEEEINMFMKRMNLDSLDEFPLCSTVRTTAPERQDTAIEPNFFPVLTQTAEELRAESVVLSSDDLQDYDHVSEDSFFDSL